MRYTFLLSWYQICSSPAASSLLPHDTAPRATKLSVKPFWLSTLPHSAILFIASSPHPQALILLKIAPAARTYGLHLCSEACFISLVFRILFPLSLKRASSIYMLRSCFIKRPGIKYIKYLKAAIRKYREFAVKTEISKYFIFSQEKPSGETFSKITIKVSKGFSFSTKPPKKWNAAPRHIVAGLKPLYFSIFKALGKKGGWRKQVHLWQVSKASQLQYYLVKILQDNAFFTRSKSPEDYILSSALS